MNGGMYDRETTRNVEDNHEPWKQRGYNWPTGGLTVVCALVLTIQFVSFKRPSLGN